MAKKKTTRKAAAATDTPAAPSDLDYAGKLLKAADGIPSNHARRGLEPIKLKSMLRVRGSVGRVHRYFLGKFALAYGKVGRELCAPRITLRRLVESCTVATPTT